MRIILVGMVFLSTGLCQNLKPQPITLEAPAIVAYCILSDDDAIPSGDVDKNEIASDMYYYCSKVNSNMIEQGIHLYQVYSDKLSFCLPSGIEYLYPEQETIKVGYLFLTSEMEKNTISGVLTDVELISEAKAYFDWKGESVNDAGK